METITIKFKKVHPDAKLPTQAHFGDVGFDLATISSFSLNPHETLMVDTGLELADMQATDKDNNSLFIHVVSRSGLATKGIFVIGGIVDSAIYRGQIKVILHNGSNKKHDFNSGDRIAQFVIQKAMTNDERNTVLIQESDTKTETNRYESGFGSSGLK